MKSQLSLSTKLNAQGRTQFDRYFAQSPFKLLPLPNEAQDWPHGLRVMQMSASPGLLAGDQIEIELELAANTALNLQTQAFTRVQAMNAGDYASQNTQIRLAPNSRLFYLPHPLVLHKDAALRQRTEIQLSENCQLIYGEIVAAGRVLNGERFAFRHFASSLKISFGEQLLLQDRIQWLPAQMDLTAIGQMENFTHQGALVFMDSTTDSQKSGVNFKALVQRLQPLCEQSAQQQMLAGVSQLNQMGVMVRVLGHRAEHIQNLFNQLAQVLRSDEI